MEDRVQHEVDARDPARLGAAVHPGDPVRLP